MKIVPTLLLAVLCSVHIGLAQGQDCLAFKTQTPSAWGVAESEGSDLTKYLHQHFHRAFRGELKLGCDVAIKFTSIKAITQFLPTGGKPVRLTASLENPNIKLGNLASQLVALSLTVGFDAYDERFSTSQSLLKDLIITEGTFKGWTVERLLEEGNQVLGNCPSKYSASEVAYALAAINENFIDGKAGSFLSCPVIKKEVPKPVVTKPQPKPQATVAKQRTTASTANRTGAAEKATRIKTSATEGLGWRAYPSPIDTDVTIEFSHRREDLQKEQPFRYMVNNLKGTTLIEGRSKLIADGRLKIGNLGELEDGRYIIKLIFGKHATSISLVK